MGAAFPFVSVFNHLIQRRWKEAFAYEVQEGERTAVKGKKRALSLLLAALLPGLCACQAGDGLPTSEASPEVTLPPASQSYVAPIGDAALEYTADATLYLPRHSGSRLTAVVSPVT